MSKTIPLALAAGLLFALSGPASAQRPSSTAMSCAQAAGLVQSQGAVVLGTGGMTYDRYVANQSFCLPLQVTKTAFAPTRDTRACMVGYTCIDPFNDRIDPGR